MSEPLIHRTGADFSAADRDAVYRAIRMRRDIRSFRREEISDEVLWRLLDAAHRAGSVGFMQPWNFVVIRDGQRRKQLVEHFSEVNARASKDYASDRRERYLSLKLQGILDAPVNLLVTCDTGRGGPNVLGRVTMPETDVYSTCLAIQNLWLAARVEGLGVGWISILEPSFVAESFGLPEGVIPVAYLALGRPIEFPREPLLERVGWREREKLEQLVFRERFGEPFGMSPLSTKDASEPDRMRSDPEVRDRAEERLDALTKPKGSLGRLEELALQLCAVQGTEFPRVDRRVLLLFAGDHGVAEEGVSAYRTEITARMVYQFVAGGAAVNALARRTGLPLRIIDVGVDHDFESAKGVRHAKVRRGTRNMRRESAMTESETRAALEAGAAAVRAEDNLEVVALGEMGIANTTPAAALICALLELDPTEVVGRGTGVGEKTLQTKRDVVRDALALHAATSTEPLELLARLGGYEIAALVGAILEAASRRVLVVLDGFIVGAAALVAHRLRPEVLPHLVAGHVGGELGHRVVLESLGLHPLLDLDLRLGEGSGAVMALDLVDAAARILGEMDTFEEAGIERPDRPEGLR